jgi:hypothetical protein
MPIILDVEQRAREVFALSQTVLEQAFASGDIAKMALIQDARRKMKTFLNRFRSQPIGNEDEPNPDCTTKR